MLDDPLELLGGLRRKERDGGALAEGNSGKQTQKGGKIWSLDSVRCLGHPLKENLASYLSFLFSPSTFLKEETNFLGPG